MSIIKPDIATLVAGQLPEFIREDYQTFVAFLEAYYEWLENQTTDVNGNIHDQINYDYASIGSIDTTLDSFVQYFKNEVALNFPALLVDDRFLIPRIREVYASKGTEASFRLLFRMLFNKDIDIKYPSEQMLRVSDGKWVQDVSFFANIISGNPASVVGQIVEISTTPSISTGNKTIRLFVDSYRSVNNSSYPNVYEFFVSGTYSGAFQDGDIVKFGSTFVASVKSTATTIQILQPGSGFRIGQLYSVGDYGSVIKIIAVDSNGGIKNAKFVSFGIGYTTSFSAYLTAQTSGTISGTQSYFNFNPDTGTIPNLAASTFEYINNIADSGVINLYDYANYYGDYYVDPTYSGTVIATFGDSTSTSTTTASSKATLNIGLGTLAKYIGYYKNNDGFLDDTIYIQDSKYYQDFSYVIKIDEMLDSYKSFIKNTIHPAGTEIFGEYLVDITLNMSSSINIIETGSKLGTESLVNLITESGDYLIVG